MEEFSISTKLTLKDYSKVMLLGLYRKPGIILITIYGLFIEVIVILDYFKVTNVYSKTPYFEAFSGLFLLLIPVAIILITRKQYLSNPSLLKEIIYTFSDTGFRAQGFTFNSEFSWAHIIKQKEISKFLILYHTKKSGNFIDRTKLTAEQINFIKSKVAST